MYCDDSRVTQVDAKEVVVSLPCDLPPSYMLTKSLSQGKPAYILYYKRVKT